MAADVSGRVVVLSDFHFGAEEAVLSREDKVEELLSELRELGDIDRLVLLGDVWDLWRTGLPRAVEAGGAFFRALASWGDFGAVVLVAGNHDYHLKTYADEALQRELLGWDGIVVGGAHSCPSGGGSCGSGAAGGDMNGDGYSVEGLALDLRYPLVHLDVAGRSVLLMHGHHLDFFSRSFWWTKVTWLARWVLGTSGALAISDVDRLNMPFFELLTDTAHVPELADREYRLYHFIRSLAKLLRFESRKEAGSPRRYTSIDENLFEAADLLEKLLPGYIPDLFVFGHTHRAGFARIRVGSRPVLLANSGCWLEEDGDETCGTYLVIDDAVRLRRLGEWETTVEIRGNEHTG